jgi:hypothetical protein
MPHLLVDFRMFGLCFLNETGFELKIAFELASSNRMLSNLCILSKNTDLEIRTNIRITCAVFNLVLIWVG